MRERPRKTDPPQFLSGWKEIANYLGKGVRTVQRYERQMGLPVRRPAGKSWGSVVATKAELDAWVSASPIREVFRLSGPDPGNDFAASSEAMRRGLAEMTRLRQQMFALRAEVRKSVHVLRESVYDLQGELNQNRWTENSPSPTPVKPDALEEGFDLLVAPTDYHKAS
jgi:hypothetical protein